MEAYAEVYLTDVVENQGKLFDYVSQHYEGYDTEDFINAYMTSKTRKSIDEAMAYVNTMETDKYSFKLGETLKGFLTEWIGKFYAYYQWYYFMPSSEVVAKIPVSFLKKAYPGLHDLDLELAVKKVGIV